ncbi:MAG: aspartate kinase [Candidatus Caldarchaeum sp.]|nr:aspartate kinase [Candidatus Caldarchaeum sp.]MCS7137707.1 aspartate kinase [Candidatus Caldarchaeum sp.]MDW7977576.1 aspartate kinase [Candidatus Caldarchaeum sp.]MDW8360082.1 aspartate kinase [Candidatus Caldarchaeum sp.]
MRLVVKFGGSVLSDEEGIEKAAEYVKSLRQAGSTVVVVVSALKGVTDELVRTAQRLNPNASPAMLDDLLGMGERTSARMFALALEKHGVKAVVVDPSMESWPVVSDDKHLDSTPILEECRVRVKTGLEKMLEYGVVPVVCGYVAVSRTGKITTMGRGGSDTTAVVLANCLDADEVVLVKDVAGVYTSDPKSVSEANILDVLTVDEVMKLSKGGAKIIHSKALAFLHPRGKIRIGSLENIDKAGTVILGVDTPKLDVSLDNTNATMVTILGRSMGDAEKINAAVAALQMSGAKILAASIEEESMILYLDGDGEVVEKLHDYFVGHGLGKAVSHFPHLSLIRIHGSMLEVVPGIVHRVIQPLASHAINVYGILTISSSIRIFVSTRDAEKAVKLVKQSIEELRSSKGLES